MRARLLTVFPILLVVWAPGCNRITQYGLPIVIGATSDEVREKLGAPTARYRPPTADDTADSIQNPPKDAESVIEWYHSSGITASFSRDRLSNITLYTYTEYKGFVPYTGTVVNGVKLTDTKQAILGKLGTPVKIENEDLQAGTDPDEPVVWPKTSTYYWHLKDCAVEATFLNQAQNVNEEKN